MPADSHCIARPDAAVGVYHNMTIVSIWTICVFGFESACSMLLALPLPHAGLPAHTSKSKWLHCVQPCGISRRPSVWASLTICIQNSTGLAACANGGSPSAVGE